MFFSCPAVANAYNFGRSLPVARFSESSANFAMFSVQKFFSVLAPAALGLALCAAGSTVFARPVTDHLNRTVELADRPERVAVADIFPYASAVCVYLGGCEKIIAMHPTSMAAAKKGLLGELYPDVLKINTTLMQGADINLESLIALKPDVVFVNAGNKRLIARLEGSGIPALAVSTSKWDYNVLETYEHWIDLLDKTFPGEGNASKALARAREIEQLVAERTAEIAPEHRRRVLFLVQYDAKRIVTSGSRFFGQYWASASGAVNVGHELTLEKGNAVIDFERVLAWNPDAVFITNFTAAQPKDVFEATYHDWSGVKAAQTHNVYKMPLGLYRGYTPSADSPLTLLWMASTLYPERFADLRLDEQVQSFYKDVYGIEITLEKARELFPMAHK